MPGAQPGRDHDAPERQEDVVREIRQHPASVGLRFDGAERREDPGMVEGERHRAGPAEDIDDRQGHGRRGWHGERAAAHDHEVRSGQGDRIGQPVGAARVVVPFAGRIVPGGVEPLEGGPRGGKPQARAVAGRVAPGRDPQVPQPVPDRERVVREG